MRATVDVETPNRRPLGAVLAAAAVTMCAGPISTAHAEDDDGPSTWFSLPLMIGVQLGGGANSDLAIGTRPELIFARGLERDPISQIGFGGYGEVVAGGGRRVVGGGLTVVRYGFDASFALSFGLHADLADSDDRNTGAVASLFLGIRGKRWNIGCDAPYGIRIDARSSFDGERTVALSAQIDVPGILFGLVSGLVFKPPG